MFLVDLEECASHEVGWSVGTRRSICDVPEDLVGCSRDHTAVGGVTCAFDRVCLTAARLHAQRKAHVPQVNSVYTKTQRRAPYACVDTCEGWDGWKEGVT